LESAAKDEVFGVTSVINLPDSQKLGSFDISFVDPANGVYLLADRTNKSIAVVDTSTNTLTHQLTAPAPGFAGAVLCPVTGAANDCAGPDGVLVANGAPNGGSNAQLHRSLFTVISGTDDKAKCVAQGGPATGMSDGEPQLLKVDCP
jgi:hypothetical protein